MRYDSESIGVELDTMCAEFRGKKRASVSMRGLDLRFTIGSLDHGCELPKDYEHQPDGEGVVAQDSICLQSHTMFLVSPYIDCGKARYCKVGSPD